MLLVGCQCSLGGVYGYSKETCQPAPGDTSRGDVLSVEEQSIVCVGSLVLIPVCLARVKRTTDAAGRGGRWRRAIKTDA
jgi:hypothetical protein